MSILVCINTSNCKEPCTGCSNINSPTKFWISYTHKKGNYCNDCLEVIKICDETYRQDHVTFWEKYPTIEERIIESTQKNNK